MLKNEFNEWLSERLKGRSRVDCISRCRRVEKALNIDLDEEYFKDKGNSLLELLKYSAKNERDGVPVPDGFNFNGKTPVSMRMGEVRQAVKKYYGFLNER